jgi:hypothetical protein
VAEVVDELPEALGRTGRSASYPWDEWLDGRVWRLTRGEDFHSKPRYFGNMAQVSGARRGVKVETRVDGDVLYIRALR